MLGKQEDLNIDILPATVEWPIPRDGAVVGHVGFDKVEAGDDRTVDTHAYAHYLHHKNFAVNYSDGMLPIDKWFGTWHDGTRNGDRIMQDRYKHKKERRNTRNNPSAS
jgi:sterol desaturase/sphingolipid hydroxylase (fatty acid hydroxylase superfamily)